jgi:hypothetical protein
LCVKGRLEKGPKGIRMWPQKGAYLIVEAHAGIGGTQAGVVAGST